MAQNKVNLIVKNVRVYNSYFKKFIPGDVWILDGKFYYIDEKQTEAAEADEIIDGAGRFMVPGLIDIHMHIESSMMTPVAFARQIAAYGVTTVVSEPHEMANVNGVKGIIDMIAAGENSLIDIYYGIPSCVPSTTPEFETTGGIIDCEAMMSLKARKEVVCVGEVMSYRQIIQENQLEISRFLEQLRKEDSLFPIEGHCPSLTDLDLAKFLYLGINGDHTEHDIEELRQRFANGMFVEIQGKMLKPEIIDFIAENQLFEHFCFVTDDVMADTFIAEGHLNTLVKMAIALGLTPEQAIYNATFTAARRMNLLDRGAIAPGKVADFLLLDDLLTFEINATYKNGRQIYQKGDDLSTIPAGMNSTFPTEYYESIHISDHGEDTLVVKSEQSDGPVKVRAIKVMDGTTKTQEVFVDMEVKDSKLLWEGRGCLLAAVYERYGKNGNIGLGFLTGDCHKIGAAASSYAHDCHNVLVAGANVRDMLRALDRLIELNGGMVVTLDGEVQAELPLKIGGILYDGPAANVGTLLGDIRKALTRQGYQHYSPIMSFGTLTLPVSPRLKITDMGIIDVENSEIVPLILPPHE